VCPDPELLLAYAAPEDRRDWWLARLVRCAAVLARGSAP